MWLSLLKRLPFLSFLSPYLIWIKVAIIVALSAFSFWAGVRWESGAANAQLLKAERSAHEWEEKAKKNADDLLMFQLNQRSDLEKQRLKIEHAEELKRAEALRRSYEFWNNNRNADIVIDPGAVRLWRFTNDEDGGTGKTTPSAAAGTIDAGSERCTLSDLHRNHASLVEQYRELAADHRDLQSWARDAMKVCNAPSVKQK